jgi:hypothetical protein
MERKLLAGLGFPSIIAGCEELENGSKRLAEAFVAGPFGHVRRTRKSDHKYSFIERPQSADSVEQLIGWKRDPHF